MNYTIEIELYCKTLFSGVTLVEKSVETLGSPQHESWELLLHLSKQIFDEIFILYPDPWPKARHEKRRILHKENLSLFLSKLKINGKVFIATDVKNYFDSIFKLFESNVNVKIINVNNFYSRPKKIIITRYEKKALSNKIKPLYLEAKKILD